jgi:type III secretion system YscD/HrpQ family protein
MDELMKGFPDRGLVAKPHPDGSWTITGRLATDAERQVLRDAASVTGLTVKVQVTVESERVAAVKLFADANQAPGRLELRVEQGREGAVRIAGAAATLEDAASLQEKARRELAEQEPLEFDIVQPEQIERLFIKRLTEAGLKDKFQIVQGAPKLVVRATLTPPDIRAFELAFAEFTKQHGSVLPIVAQVQPERDVIAASVGTVVGGAFPYIVTTSGQRVAPGGLLGGHTVVAVRDGEIILSEGLRVRYGP